MKHFPLTAREAAKKMPLSGGKGPAIKEKRKEKINLKKVLTAIKLKLNETAIIIIFFAAAASLSYDKGL